jgi:RNA polymerase sigma-70 factor (sigma-E family)
MFVFDESAMTVLVQREWMPLIRLATLLLGDRASAEDVVQESCEAVWRARPMVTGPDHLAGYLRTAVVNRARSAGRRRGTARRLLAQLERPTAPPADAQLLADEDQRRLLAALDRLTPRQREVLVLRYWARLREGEIAETLGIAPGTVKSTAHQALQALHKSLKGF